MTSVRPENNMKTTKHPGVYVPPPLIYVAFFFLSVFLQRLWPLDPAPLDTPAALVAGWVFIALFVIINVMAIRRFIVSRNTVVTVKPARSLQTTGIYAISRNPMYLALVALYCGLAVLAGSIWTFLVLPVLIAVIQIYVIRREERYLAEAFGDQYDDYRRKVRRWI